MVPAAIVTAADHPGQVSSRACEVYRHITLPEVPDQLQQGVLTVIHTCAAPSCQLR